jgi:hypothetical protein
MTGIYRMPWLLARATRHEFDVTFVTCDIGVKRS